MLKTEGCYYPEENFVQEGDTLRELTVEITLDEYRELITGQADNAALIGRLEAEKEQLEEEVKTLRECLTAFVGPELINELGATLLKIFNPDLCNVVSCDDEEADNAEET